MRNFMMGGVALLAVMVAGCTTTETDENKTWRGYWDGNRQYRSTVVFLDENRLRYCFQSQCTTAGYVGDPKGTVRFNWGRAAFTFKWTGNGYQLTRRTDHTTNTGFLT